MHIIETLSVFFVSKIQRLQQSQTYGISSDNAGRGGGGVLYTLK